MARPRTSRKDLPVGLHVDRWGSYYYRGTKTADRRYVSFGKVTREVAIKRWVELTTLPPEAEAGTVAELIDLFLANLTDVADKTRENYEFHCGKLKARWGDRRYAVTANDAARGGALRAFDISTYIAKARKAGRGAVSAGAAVGVLSIVFSRAREAGLVEYNPCQGVRRPQAKKLVNLPTLDEILAVQQRAGPRMALMVELAWRTGMRQTDILRLQVQDVAAQMHVTQHKTKMQQDWTMTPELVTLFAAAAKLPGRNRSMFVFPQRNGKPLSAKGLASEWRPLRMECGFQFRAIRKWAINEAKDSGRDATDFAGHADPKTTRQHYEVRPKKVTPL